MDLSILIPARNEEFLNNTIQDILKNIEADTEIIVALDGQWAVKGIPHNERVSVIYIPESIGQRASTNLACNLARGKYVMKLDAHCSFDKGFDRKMLEAFKETGDDVTMVPIMRNLHAFDWKCHRCGWKTYQDKAPKRCGQCNDSRYLRKKMLWIGKHNPQSTSYCFDSKPQFKYFENWKHRPEYIKDKREKGLTETMSLQGSCFMCTREKYWELRLCDEEMGSWGNQGIEVACKTWLSGGRVLCNHKTWYAHLFRTKTEFGFPWPVSGNDQHRTKKKVRDLIWEMKCPKQIYPVKWLVEKFWPVPDWTEEDLKKIKEEK
ncbi:glycosyltransferase [Patescibacteria group bacterium]|nr:glycosyltransferase [Patescibacteria group bacterium]